VLRMLRLLMRLRPRGLLFVREMCVLDGFLLLERLLSRVWVSSCPGVFTESPSLLRNRLPWLEGMFSFDGPRPLCCTTFCSMPDFD
jgi:hypothetical protein